MMGVCRQLGYVEVFHSCWSFFSGIIKCSLISGLNGQSHTQGHWEGLIRWFTLVSFNHSQNAMKACLQLAL